MIQKKKKKRRRSRRPSGLVGKRKTKNKCSSNMEGLRLAHHHHQIVIKNKILFKFKTNIFDLTLQQVLFFF
jgi:hypothetical protein